MSFKENNDLLKKLNHIPHLNLNKSFNLELLKSEYNNIDKSMFHAYNSASRTDRIRNTVNTSWWGCSLTSSTGMTDGDLTENPRSSCYYLTEAAKLCPYMMSVVNELSDENTSSARIMLVKPGGQLTWHTHQIHDVNTAFSFGEMTIHIPIICPPKFKYSVIPIEEYRLVDFETIKPKTYSMRYPEGEAWVFNSHHMHNIFNYDDHDRVSLMIYLYIDNEKTRDIILDAVRSYSGELIP